MAAFTQNLDLPVRNRPVRFAVGPPDGITSNSWKCWTEKSGVYIACRDNFQQAKVSLHTCGRWRMGFTREAIKKHPGFIPADRNRAWRVWDEPPAQLPDTVLAFRLIFLTSELAVNPAQRPAKKWANVIFIEAAPAGSGKMVVASLFVTKEDRLVRHQTEPSLWLASLEMGDGRRAQLVVHGDAEGEFPQIVDRGVREARSQAERAGIILNSSTADPNNSFQSHFRRKPEL